jgi:hypothetical protein
LGEDFLGKAFRQVTLQSFQLLFRGCVFGGKVGDTSQIMAALSAEMHFLGILEVTSRAGHRETPYRNHGEDFCTEVWAG